MNINYFEYATRNKLRFPYHGVLSVEDLWDLSLEALDEIYKNLNKQKKDVSEDSLLGASTSEDAILVSRIEIVKYIFGVKKQEAENRRNEAAKREEKRKILEVLARKKEDSLTNMTEEELMKKLEELS